MMNVRLQSDMGPLAPLTSRQKWSSSDEWLIAVVKFFADEKWDQHGQFGEPTLEQDERK
jgi:hypothetical protein